MVGIASGAVLNIALDPLLIFTFDLGVAGAACLPWPGRAWPAWRLSA
jgi:hypothetical protein